MAELIFSVTTYITYTYNVPIKKQARACFFIGVNIIRKETVR